LRFRPIPSAKILFQTEEPMTELTDQQSEALEHAHHSAHAGESGDPMTLRVTLSIAVMAVIAAFIGALGETEASHTFVEKNDAVLAQARASDAWANYQAESLKKHVYDVGVSLAGNPATAERLQGESNRFAKEQPEIENTARQFETEVQAHNMSAAAHFERHHTLTLAEGLIHVAIAGASIALLARRRAFWIGSIVLTAAGIAVTGIAYAL
jgi:hypothetical protein